MCSSILRSCDGLRTAAWSEQNPKIHPERAVSARSSRTFVSARRSPGPRLIPLSIILPFPLRDLSVNPAGLRIARRDTPIRIAHPGPRIPDPGPRSCVADAGSRIPDRAHRSKPALSRISAQGSRYGSHTTCISSRSDWRSSPYRGWCSHSNRRRRRRVSHYQHSPQGNNPAVAPEHRHRRCRSS